MAFKLSSIHIFGYGETQVIGKDGETSVNKKVSTSNLTKVPPLVDDIYSHKPQENQSPNEYHAINILSDMFADYQPKGEFKSWRTKWAELNETNINELVAEVLAFTPPTTPTTPSIKP